MPDNTWIEPEAPIVPPDFQQAVGGHPLVAETLLRRGIQNIEEARTFFYQNEYLPSSPSSLPDMERGVSRIADAIRKKERIGVWGDFDVDGQTATALLISALRQLNADCVYHIPVRANESHGINIANLKNMLDQGVKVILTCDTGISANDAVTYASSHGVETIINDHHVLPDTFPDAFALINPQRLPSSHPLFPLCGVGTAYKFAEGLFEILGTPFPQSNFIDLAALGTVADLAVLQKDNRWIVQQGLSILRTNPRLSLLTIFENAEIEYQNLTEKHLGFVVGPRLNAIGRLGDANPLVEYLLSGSLTLVRPLAEEIEGVNSQRKFICDQVFKAAQSQVENNHALLSDPILILENPDWPAGVLGIVASRLVELYHLPTILLSTPSGKPAHGSARSIEGIHITQAITQQHALLNSYGGHPMAAGLSLPQENISAFKRAMIRTINKISQASNIQTRQTIDAVLPLHEVTPSLVEDFERLAPFGPGNPQLVLASSNLSVLSSTTIGKNNEHLQVIVEDEAQGETRRILWWQGANSPMPQGKFDLAYTVHASNYRGQPQMQFEWIASRPSTSAAVEISSHENIEIIDYRHSREPEKELISISQPQDLLIWAEGNPGKRPAGSVDRYNLRKADALAIFTVPPGRAELSAALNKVTPHKVYLFANTLDEQNLLQFLQNIGGYLRYAFKAHDGWLNISKISALTAQKERTVQQAVSWFCARGDITLERQEKEMIRIRDIKKQPEPELCQSIEQELKILLGETTAFKKYYLRADACQLIEPVKSR